MSPTSLKSNMLSPRSTSLTSKKFQLDEAVVKSPQKSRNRGFSISTIESPASPNIKSALRSPSITVKSPSITLRSPSITMRSPSITVRSPSISVSTPANKLAHRRSISGNFDFPNPTTLNVEGTFRTGRRESMPNMEYQVEESAESRMAKCVFNI